MVEVEASDIGHLCNLAVCGLLFVVFLLQVWVDWMYESRKNLLYYLHLLAAGFFFCGMGQAICFVLTPGEAYVVAGLMFVEVQISICVVCLYLFSFTAMRSAHDIAKLKFGQSGFKRLRRLLIATVVVSSLTSLICIVVAVLTNDKRNLIPKNAVFVVALITAQWGLLSGRRKITAGVKASGLSSNSVNLKSFDRSVAATFVATRTSLSLLSTF